MTRSSPKKRQSTDSDVSENPDEETRAMRAAIRDFMLNQARPRKKTTKQPPTADDPEIDWSEY